MIRINIYKYISKIITINRLFKVNLLVRINKLNENERPLDIDFEAKKR